MPIADLTRDPQHGVVHSAAGPTNGIDGFPKLLAEHGPGFRKLLSNSPDMVFVRFKSAGI
jgi:hypothetical protein